MLACLGCRVRLSRVKIGRRYFWACGVCKGRLVNMSVLRRLVARPAVNALWRAARAAEEGGRAAGGQRKCPSCGRAMARVSAWLADGAPVLDVCRRCQVVWFDAMEYQALPPSPDREAGGGRGKPSPKARKAVAMLRLEQLEQRASAESGPEGPEEWWRLIPAFFGLPVEEDMATERRPWATWGTAAIILVVSLLAFRNGAEVFQRYGLVPARAWRDGGATFVTSFFLHGGWLHLLGNLYFLLVFGDNVEDFLGRWRWVALVLLATLAGDVLHIALDPRSDVPLIGASGGISGLLAFYAFKFPRARLFVMMGYMGRFAWGRIPALGFFLFWVLLQVIGAMSQREGLSSVSSFAHLGGVGAGVIFWLAWRKRV